MDYQNYSTEQFVGDEEFNRWVKNPTPNDRIFWKNWLQCHPEKIQQVTLAKEIIVSINFTNQEPSNEDYDEVLQNILKAGNSEKSQWERLASNTSRRKWYSIAAAITLLISGYLIYDADLKTQPLTDSLLKTHITENPPGTKSHVMLPDGSKVILNAASKLVFPLKFLEGSREVELYGEAYFEVERDERRPFKIKTGNITTTVLGTSFNIKSGNDQSDVQISLASGKVKVEQYSEEHKLVNTHYLLPGEEINFINKNTPTVFRYNWERVFGWKEGLIYFENAGKIEVLERLEEWYGVKFELVRNNSEVWDVTAKFQEQSLENVLKNLSFTVGFEYEIIGKRVELNLKH